MAEHHLGAIDFELSKFKNKSRIEGYRAAYFKDDEHHSGSMTFVFRGPLEPVVYARYPYEEEMVFEVGYIGLINDEISFRPYKKLLGHVEPFQSLTFKHIGGLLWKKRSDFCYPFCGV